MVGLIPSQVFRRREKSPTKIIFVTTPRSGTLFLNDAFTGGVALPNLQPSPSSFPHDYLDDWLLRRERHYSTVSVAHSAPSLANRRHLEDYLGRWLVHIRDPRRSR